MANEPVAVVTGGAQGIGAAVVSELAARGHHVAILDQNLVGAEAVRKEVIADGGRATAIECDLIDPRSVADAAAVVAALGDVAVLVNCAGWLPSQKFLEQSPETWQQLVAINYMAVLYTCHAFHDQLTDQGAIVNVSSDAARVGVSGQAVYAGAKAGVIAFSKSIALEFARRGIRVNVVCPGSTRTPMLEGLFSEEEIAKRVRVVPLRRLAEPEDVAATVVFLAVDATHVTGQVISVNGGALRAG